MSEVSEEIEKKKKIEDVGAIYLSSEEEEEDRSTRQEIEEILSNKSFIDDMINENISVGTPPVKAERMKSLGRKTLK